MVRWAQYITGLAHTRAICHQKLLLASGVMGEPHGCSGLGVPRTERVHTGGCLSGRCGVWSGRLGRPARGRGRTSGGGALAEAADAEVAARERERDQAVVEEFLRYSDWRDELLEEEETYFRRRDEDYYYYRTGGH